MQRPDGDASIAALRARFAASRARGDRVQLREEARFVLALEGDAATALKLARSNWATQREPADLRILAEAAHAANDADALATVRRWLADTRIEQAAITSLLMQPQGVRK